MAKPITRVVRSKSDLQKLMLWLNARSEFPFTIQLKRGEPTRTVAQNRLQWQWFNDAAAQGDQTASEYRAYCKLHFGVPILREENEDFRAQYDALVRPLAYEHKLALMLEPIELPVTSLMNTKQKTRYLDAVWQHFTGQGYQLTDPAMLGIADWREAA